MNTSTNQNLKGIKLKASEIQFNKKDFNNKLAQYIQKEAFEEIIDKINKKSIEGFFEGRRIKGSIYPFTKNMAWILSFITLAFLIVVNFEKISISIPILLIIISNSMIIVLIIYIFFRKINKLTNADSKIKEKIDLYLKGVNLKYINTLKWTYNPFDQTIFIEFK